MKRGVVAIYHDGCCEHPRGCACLVLACMCLLKVVVVTMVEIIEEGEDELSGSDQYYYSTGILDIINNAHLYLNAVNSNTVKEEIHEI